jgi:hypothetical protein
VTRCRSKDCKLVMGAGEVDSLRKRPIIEGAAVQKRVGATQIVVQSSGGMMAVHMDCAMIETLCEEQAWHRKQSGPQKKEAGDRELDGLATWTWK